MNDLNNLLPVSVTVNFPQQVNGASTTVPYTITVALVSLAIQRLAGVKGHPGTHLLFSTNMAATTVLSGTATNQAELLALAEQLAADWYLWQLGRLSLKYSGIAPYIPDGFSDLEFLVWEGEVSTRVERLPWEVALQYAAGSAGYGPDTFFYNNVNFFDIAGDLSVAWNAAAGTWEWIGSTGTSTWTQSTNVWNFAADFVWVGAAGNSTYTQSTSTWTFYGAVVTSFFGLPTTAPASPQKGYVWCDGYYLWQYHDPTTSYPLVPFVSTFTGGGATWDLPVLNTGTPQLLDIVTSNSTTTPMMLTQVGIAGVPQKPVWEPLGGTTSSLSVAPVGFPVTAGTITVTGTPTFVTPPGTLLYDTTDNLFMVSQGGGVYQTLANTGGVGTGTVTSVDVSGGSTGLTTTGGPITTAGTITLAGTLNTANGGTDADLSATGPGVIVQTGLGASLMPLANGVGVLTNNGSGSLTWVPAGTGTVTSIDVSGGTTGLTTSGGPVTTTGVITLAGTLNTANGGTGADSSSATGIAHITAGTWTFSAVDLGSGDVTGSLADGNISSAATWNATTATVATLGSAAFVSTSAFDVSGAAAAAQAASQPLNSTLTSISGAGTTGTGAVVLASAISGFVTSVSNSDGTLTISPTTGAVVASIALGHANTWTADQQVALAVTTGTAPEALAVSNTTVATSTSQSGSPVFSWKTTYWDTVGLVAVGVRVDAQFTQGLLPSAVGIAAAQNVFTFTVTTAGVGSVEGFGFDTDGNTYTTAICNAVHFRGFSGTPSVAIGTGGAGTNATVFVTGNDVAGTITLTTSVLDTPSGNATIATLTFNSPFPSAYYNTTPYVIIMPANDAAWALSFGIVRCRQADVTLAHFTIRSGTVPLPALTGATYQWNYMVIQ